MAEYDAVSFPHLAEPLCLEIHLRLERGGGYLVPAEPPVSEGLPQEIVG